MPEPRPLVAIQHHPSRHELLPRLTGRLGQLEHEIVPDDGPPPDPWRGHRKCLERHREPFTHLVVIQDDAIPCPAFECELRCALEQEPDATLMLFLGAQPRLTAQAAMRALDAGESFAAKHPRDYCPVVGISYPAAHAADILAWNEEPNGRRSKSDDFMIGRWHRERQHRILATVPSLVDHPDDVPSVVGNGLGARGRNPSRTALIFLAPLVPEHD